MHIYWSFQMFAASNTKEIALQKSGLKSTEAFLAGMSPSNTVKWHWKTAVHTLIPDNVHIILKTSQFQKRRLHERLFSTKINNDAFPAFAMQ